MMLTTKGRYAVTAILELASNTDKPISLTVIAEQQNIPIRYLEQLFYKLKKAGIVKAVRGPGGGYQINHSLEKLKIADIIDAVEENINMTKCGRNADGDELAGCTIKGTKCLTHDLWYGLGLQIRQYFQEISVSDMLQQNFKK